MAKKFSRGRRDFLGGAASISGAALAASTLGSLALSGCRKAPDVPSVNERHKAVVIGSGFGGAIASYHLSQKGVETVVLERGRRWPVSAAGDTFPTWNKPDRRVSWLSSTPTFPLAPLAIFKPYVGLIERVKGRQMDIVCGSGVGGSSLVFGGMMLRPPKDLFDRVMPAGLSYDEFDQIYYPRVKAMVGISQIPDDVLNNVRYTSSRIFLEHAEKAGYTGTRINNAFNWDVIREELEGKVVASASIGEEIYGNNSGAKNSVDRNYLALAEKTGFVQIYSQHGVENVSEVTGSNGATQYVVETYQIDDSGNPILKKMITADYLFLAAGSAGTSNLLVKARAKSTLKNLNNQIGENWGNNGDRLIARYALNEKTLPWQGCPANAAIFDHDNPNGPVTLLHGPAPLTTESRIMALLGMGIPEKHGRFVYDASEDQAVLDWDPSNDRQSVAGVMSVVDRLNTVNGGSTMDFEWLAGSFTYHPLGGAVLGKATDMVGRVMNYQRLYVVDASLIPGSTGCCNPAWTVASLAERCMDHIIDEDFS